MHLNQKNSLMNFHKNFTILLIVCFALLPLQGNAGADILVKSLNFTKENKLEISLSKKTSFKVFNLKNPNRIAVDILNAKLDKNFTKPALPSYIKGFRFGDNKENLRLVLDLNEKIPFKNSTLDIKNNKILLSFEVKNEAKNSQTKTTAKLTNAADFISQKVEEFDIETKAVKNLDGTTKYVVTKTYKERLPIIVIDAGHGGKDPGTIGVSLRTKEKNITLSYAKELGKHLVLSKKYKVYLTRDSDNFIPLFQRVEIARKKKADLFISIHANAAEDNDVSGFSIYTLSETASDKRAELLAQKENRADIIHGVNFSGASVDIMKTLIDLSQRQSKNDSAKFANIAVGAIKTSKIEILQNSHRFAGFAVLTAPDMASTLIELGYLSNKEEERLLNSIGYKRKVAESLVDAINKYFAKNKIN